MSEEPISISNLNDFIFCPVSIYFHSLEDDTDTMIFQVYAQYFSLEEMGYSVKELRLYSMDDNKVYRIEKPETNPGMLKKVEDVIFNMMNFSFNNFKGDNKAKCSNCIYEP